MTLIYVPQLIESVEQAEQLPVGTVSIADHPDDKPAVKVTPTLWVCVWDVDDDHDATYDVASNGHMIGSTVLVPIEAEDEWTVGHEDPAWAPGTEEWAREFQTHVPGRHLFRRSTTPWERIDGPSPDRRGDCA